MLNPTIEFQGSIYPEIENLTVRLKSVEVSHILSVLRHIFYFECEKELVDILKDEEKARQMVFISVRSSTRTPSSKALKKGNKLIVSKVLYERWGRDENDGYWLVLVMRYKV